MTYDPKTPPDSLRAFRQRLIDEGWMLPGGVPGIVGWSGAFERIVEGFEAAQARCGAWQRAEVLRFPPLFPRADYARTGHLRKFPNQVGAVETFEGGPAETPALLDAFDRGDDWSRYLGTADMMLVPAACYPLYATARGTLPADGRTVDIRTPVFRHEPSDDPFRVQCFRQREYVRLGTPEQALAHRDHWVDAGRALLGSIGLECEATLASDPFFGSGARLLRASQLEQALKFEFTVTLWPDCAPVSLGSSNLHLDHFTTTFDVRCADGARAHSACCGFGLERVALALLATHGTDPSRWPDKVRAQLGMA